MHSGTFTAKYMLACLMDTLQQFHSFGFQVSALILDGATSNLSMIKLLMGVKGVFGHNDHHEERHRISPCIRNPFTGQNIHVMICPSHQVSRKQIVFKHNCYKFFHTY